MQILKLATALPENEFSTEELLKAFPCTLPEQVKQNVLNLGVRKRCLISHRSLSQKSEAVLGEDELVDLCSEACGKALDKADIPTSDIGYFIATYDVNPFLSPGLSQILVRQLGFNPYIRHVNAQGIASTAFPKALELAGNHLAAHPDDYVLICVSGVSSYWFQNQVRGLRNVAEISQIRLMRNAQARALQLRNWVATMEFFLFGDGVAAAVVAKGKKGLSVKRLVEVTNVGKNDYLAGYSRLSAVNEPFRFGFYSHLDRKIPDLGVKYTKLALKKLLGKNAKKITSATKKWVIHTGSQKILNLLAEGNAIDGEKIAESRSVLQEYGNLSGASLPFILEKVVSDGGLSVGDVILMVGYGWGFSAAAGLLEIS
ncbi:MAG TPA: 3-oxoacyl-[acyl-carrier-protein] synthase III C-terminal domain-containing protein [Candidatus Acidoferrum sp.]|jgi:alkylresorcinol/alkylpyrone synthase|nr:3-oxoacyl-[acyl-carrier-protein] synthase III C-terminal domain-containing protein [Candidatus Acidoferrum sp.]